MTDTMNTTAAAHLADAANHEAARNASWERSDTDGFVTQWAHGISADIARRNAEIAANGGLAEFPALFDLDGNLVAAKLVRVYDRYKFAHVSKWVVLTDDDPRSAAAAWINAFPVRKSTMVRKGYTEGTVLAPAIAKTWAPEGARGLGGCTQVCVISERTDGGFSRDVEIVTSCRTYDA